MTFKPDVTAKFPASGVRAHAPSPAPALTSDELATLVDITNRYLRGTATAATAMAWIYGLLSNSAVADQLVQP